MIEYKLKDKDGNTYSLNGSGVTVSLKQTVTQESDSFTFDNKIVERSFLPGSQHIGHSRLQSREFKLTFERVNDDLSSYRIESNQLISFIQKTAYIIDVTNNMELRVVVRSMDIDYLQGSLKKYSTDTFSFIALDPWWTDLTKDTLTGSSISNTIEEISLNNLGYLETPIVITLVATVATDDIQIYLTSNSYGISLSDSLFGTSGNLTMIINCETGNVTIGNVNRNASIDEGTGFFNIPIGTDKLNILANESLTYTIEYYKRYYL